MLAPLLTRESLQLRLLQTHLPRASSRALRLSRLRNPVRSRPQLTLLLQNTTAESTDSETTIEPVEPTEQTTTAGPLSIETTLQTTTAASTTTSHERERGYPCIIHTNPGLNPTALVRSQWAARVTRPPPLSSYLPAPITPSSPLPSLPTNPLRPLRSPSLSPSPRPMTVLS